MASHRIGLQKHYYPLQPIAIEHSPGFVQKRKCLKNQSKTYNSFTLPPVATYRILPRLAHANIVKRWTIAALEPLLDPYLTLTWPLPDPYLTLTWPMSPGRAHFAKCYCLLHFSDMGSPWPLRGRIQSRHGIASYRIGLRKHDYQLQPIGIEHAPAFVQKRKCLKKQCKTYNSFTLSPVATYT